MIPLRRNHKTSIVIISAKQLPDDCFAIEQVIVLHPFIHEQHATYLHPSNIDSCAAAADSENECIDTEQPSVLTRIACTPRLDNRLACKPIGKKYFHIFDNEIDLWSRYCCLEDFDLAHWCVTYNVSRAAVIELFRNLMIATGSNFSSSHTLFKRLHQMSYTIARNS